MCFLVGGTVAQELRLRFCLCLLAVGGWRERWGKQITGPTRGFVLGVSLHGE
jgi:hypothetical protein